jgi:hypothetical protein
MAKRRPNPLKSPKAKRRPKLKDPFGDAAFFGIDPADVLFGMLGALFGARPFPQTTLFQQYRCSKCGARYQTNAQGPVSFCPMGCGETTEALGQAGRAMPPRARVQKMSREEAARFVAAHACVSPGKPHAGDDCPSWADVLNSRDKQTRAYRRSSARLHPDNKETGNHELFVKLQEAMEVLEG